MNFTTIWRTRTRALAAAEGSDADKAGSVDRVKAAICDNVNLYIEKNEEEFQRFLQTFVQDVWTLLTKTGLEPNKDHLATSGVRFLTTVANSVHHSLFAGGDTLRQVCESIVIPNLQFREDDEELFESNWVEYVRRDIEGSDSDTRRRGACELVRGLAAKFPEATTQSVSGYVTALLGQHAADPVNSWKAKDAAVYLVISLTVKSQSVVKGATETNELVSITDFFQQQIAPELAAAAANPRGGGVGRAVLHADALKFLTIFRGQIPKAMVLPVIPAVVALLTSDSNVVHTYAANCLERLLTVREPVPAGGSPLGARGAPRYQSADVQAHVQSVLGNLFGVFALPDSQENEYAMRAVNRVPSASSASASNPRRRRAGTARGDGDRDVQKPAQSHLLALPVRVHRGVASPRERSRWSGRLSGICSRRFNTCCNRTWWSSRRTCFSFCRR